MRSVRPSVAGALFSGLAKPTTEEVLLAHCCDRLGNLVWMNSKDGVDGINRPPSILKALLGEPETESDAVGYDSPEDFWEAMEQYDE